ncbi:MAG: 4Fe-4S dicluster domain-containing protein [Bacteroidetes bacterium]|nr:4Fe-4S dicluster domain-containing protein [Bacteroidota bacterium]
MAKVVGDIAVNIERCKGCEVCVGVCPQQVIGMSVEVNGKGYHYAGPVNDKCTGCENCALVCPDGCITVYRMKVEVEQ